jgi:hypothetical protein
MSSILELIRRPRHPSRRDIEDIKLTFQELCYDLDGRYFSHTTQERLVDVLGEMPPTSHSTGKQQELDAYETTR